MKTARTRGSFEWQLSFVVIRRPKREDLMKRPLTIAFAAALAAAFALPLAVAAQERYPALNPEQLSPQQKAYVENLQKPPRNNTTALKNPPFKVYMRSPDLANKLEAVSDYVRWGTGLEPRLTELAIMITARQWSSQWIWRGHYRAAVRGGLDPSVGADIAAGRRPTKMKEDEEVLYNYATELYRDRAVSDTNYAAAVKQFGEKGLIDLVATMGYYDTVAMTLITAKAIAPKEDDVPQLAALPR
jgi:4-carboxymuconolactone decarboxylase